MPKQKTPTTETPSSHAENFHGDMRKGAYLRRQAAYQAGSADRRRSSRKPPR